MNHMNRMKYFAMKVLGKKLTLYRGFYSKMVHVVHMVHGIF